MAAFVVPASLQHVKKACQVRVDKGVQAAKGGNQTNNKLETVVAIPGRTALRFADAHMTLVDNAKYEPEQILLVKSTSPVTEKAFSGKVQAFLLPVRSPNLRRARADAAAGGRQKSCGVPLRHASR